MTAKSPPSDALTNFLQSIPPAFQSSRFPNLLSAAKRLNAAAPAKAAKDVAVMLELMQAASFYDVDKPTGPPQFPADHALHLKWGTEWYYLACTLQVQGSDGLDHVGVFVDFARNRAVSIGVQKNSNWSDEDAQITYTLASVTMVTPGSSFTVRRRPNPQWPIKTPGSITVSGPGAPFRFRIGPDVLQSPSPWVLPLTVFVDDSPNMKIELTVTSSLKPEHAFFLQGTDRGFIPSPHPGIYYSWPQLAVSGRVTLGGKSYQVSGLGWIDHQVIMREPSPPVVPPPSPAKLYQGWSWCAFNLNDGNAFTAAAFQMGNTIQPVLPVPEGFYVERILDRWIATPIVGAVDLGGFTPMIDNVSMPTDWIWKTIGLHEVALHAKAWYPRCDFEADNLVAICETPVSLDSRLGASSMAGTDPNFAGVGVCESYNYESLEAYQKRALAYLSASTMDAPHPRRKGWLSRLIP